MVLGARSFGLLGRVKRLSAASGLIETRLRHVHYKAHGFASFIECHFLGNFLVRILFYYNLFFDLALRRPGGVDQIANKKYWNH